MSGSQSHWLCDPFLLPQGERDPSLSPEGGGRGRTAPLRTTVITQFIMEFSKGRYPTLDTMEPADVNDFLTSYDQARSPPAIAALLTRTAWGQLQGLCRSKPGLLGKTRESVVQMAARERRELAAELKRNDSTPPDGEAFITMAGDGWKVYLSCPTARDLLRDLIIRASSPPEEMEARTGLKAKQLIIPATCRTTAEWGAAMQEFEERAARAMQMGTEAGVVMEALASTILKNHPSLAGLIKSLNTTDVQMAICKLFSEIRRISAARELLDFHGALCDQCAEGKRKSPEGTPSQGGKDEDDNDEDTPSSKRRKVSAKKRIEQQHKKKEQDEINDRKPRNKRLECLGCGKAHKLTDCEEPWLVTSDWKIEHADDATKEPEYGEVPRGLRRFYKAGEQASANFTSSRNFEESTASQDGDRPRQDKKPEPKRIAEFPATLGGHTSKAALDTVASHSILPARLFTRLPARHRVTPAQPFKIQTLTGSFVARKKMEVKTAVMMEGATITFREAFYQGPEGEMALICFETMVETGLLNRLNEMYKPRAKAGPRTAGDLAETGHVEDDVESPPEAGDPAETGEGESPPDAEGQGNVNEQPTALAPEPNPSRERELMSKATDTLDDDEEGEEEHDGSGAPAIGHDEDGMFDKLLREYADVFPKEVKASSLPPMRLKLIGERPKYRRPRRISRHQLECLKKEIKKMILLGIIEPAHAACAAAIVLVKKSDGSWRFTCDFRELNKAIEIPANPLPNVKDVLGSLKGHKYFTQLDLKAGYHQCMLHQESRDLCAFTTPIGLFRYKRVPQGLAASAPYFQARVNAVLYGLIGVTCEAYLDDIIVHGDTLEELERNTRQILERFRRFKMSLSLKKCKFAMKEIDFLGHRVNGETISVLPSRVEAITSLPVPGSVRQLRSFLGMTNFAREYLPNYARIARPLYDLLKKDNQYKWERAHQRSFEEVKKMLTEAPALAHFDPTKRVVLVTDASMEGVGAALLCEDDEGSLRPVEYLSKAFSPREANWSTYEQEAFGITWAIRKLRHYLIGVCFEVHTDHRNLIYLEKSDNAKVTRWRLNLQDFNFTVHHVKGLDNQLADHLSRYHGSARMTRQDRRSDNATGKEGSITTDMILKAVHNNEVGHFGVKEATRRLDVLGVKWKNRDRDVRRYVRKCAACQVADDKYRKLNTKIRNIATTEPFACLSVDLLEMPEDEKGNKYIMAAIDSFSRFVELTPIQNKEAKTVAEALLTIFGRYGAIQSLRHDEGREFHNSLVQAYQQMLGCEGKPSMPYRSPSNGQVERANRSTQSHLRKLVWDDQTIKENWARALPMVQHLMNATVINPEMSIKEQVTPIEIMYAGRVTPDRRMLTALDEPTLQEIPEPSRQHVRESQGLQEHLIKINNKHQTAMLRERAKLGPKQDEVLEGQYVLVAYPDKKKPPTKLEPRLQGPYCLIQNDEDEDDSSMLRLRDLIDGTEFKAHRSRARPFVGEDPISVAERTKFGEYLVEDILEHRLRQDLKKPHPGRAPSYEFLVTWQGYDEQWNTWEKFVNVKDTEALDKYLKTTNAPNCLLDNQQLEPRKRGRKG